MSASQLHVRGSKSEEKLSLQRPSRKSVRKTVAVRNHESMNPLLRTVEHGLRTKGRALSRMIPGNEFQQERRRSTLPKNMWLYRCQDQSSSRSNPSVPAIAKKLHQKMQCLDLLIPAQKEEKKNIRTILIPQWRKNGKLRLCRQWFTHQRPK